MFTIKICGITRREDVDAAAHAGADAIGINFYPHSPRFVQPDRAQHLAAVVPAGVAKVGVFVNADLEVVCGVADALGLDGIQLHGDEPPEFVARLAPRRVIRALRVRAAGGEPPAQPHGRDEADLWRPIADYLGACRDLGTPPAMVLVDAWQPDRYGGTGVAADWQALGDHAARLAGIPLVLAGGLNPDNVAEAIRTVRPAAIDAASGVEERPGVKDPVLMRRLVVRAQGAFKTL